MHYLALVFVESATKEAVDQALAPFKDQHWDWYRPGGRWDGWLLGEEEEKNRESQNGFNFGERHESIKDNSCKVEDLSPERVPYMFVADGKLLGRELWDGETFKTVDDYKAQYAAAIASNKGKFAVVVDIHN